MNTVLLSAVMLLGVSDCDGKSCGFRTPVRNAVSAVVEAHPVQRVVHGAACGVQKVAGTVRCINQHRPRLFRRFR